VWAEAAKALAKFPEAVVTAVDDAGYPVSVRLTAPRYDAETGQMPVVWPPDFAITEGPATVLCHYHDEKLWNIRSLQIKGRLERRGPHDWVFISTHLPPRRGCSLRFGVSARTGGQRADATSRSAASPRRRSTGTPSTSFNAALGIARVSHPDDSVTLAVLPSSKTTVHDTKLHLTNEIPTPRSR